MTRCALSDLPVEMCDHCKKGAKTLDDERELGPPEDINFYKSADKKGICVCGQRFRMNDRIGWDKDAQWWRAEKCCG